ncbi:MAG: HAD family phosphatase [Bdellovibrionaceae bacterium]|nr:HAD family phosphatase [Pseudobdellovibrionaceae bacterium]
MKLIIFDLDGTLIDSEKIAFRAVQNWLSVEGLDAPNELSLQMMGRKWSVAFDLLESLYPLKKRREVMEREILEEFRRLFRRELPIIPGAQKLIMDLSRNYKLALVSGSYRQDIYEALELMGVRDKFSIILGSEDYSESKPSPEGFLKAVKISGVTSDNVLVFEDSEAGIEGALRAGLRVVAISYCCPNANLQSRAYRRYPDLCLSLQEIEKLFPSSKGSLKSPF